MDRIYKYQHFDAKNVKCPYFKRVVVTKNGKFIGIVCQGTKCNLGFDTEMAVRMRTTPDLHDYTDIFCKDSYESCPYHKMIRGED